MAVVAVVVVPAVVVVATMPLVPVVVVVVVVPPVMAGTAGTPDQNHENAERTHRLPRGSRHVASDGYPDGIGQPRVESELLPDSTGGYSTMSKVVSLRKAVSNIYNRSSRKFQCSIPRASGVQHPYLIGRFAGLLGS